MVADSLSAENEKAANSMRWAAFEKLAEHGTEPASAIRARW